MNALSRRARRFCDDLSLRRTLSAAELHGLLLLQGALRAGQFVVADPECGDVTLAVRESDCEIRFTGTADAPRFEISLQIVGEISAVSGSRYHIGSEAFPRLEKALAAQACEAVEAYLSAAVYGAGCDAAGFGGAVLRDAPDVWRAVSADWASVLPDSVFDMNVQAAIERVEEEDTPYL